MVNKLQSIIIVFSLANVCCFSARAWNITEDIATITQRLKNEYLKSDYKAGIGYFKTLTPGGAWSDIDYANQGNSVWKPIVHLQRVVGLCTTMETASSGFFNDAQMLTAIKSALAYWLQRKPQSVNWWQNTIAQQLYIEKILILAGDKIGGELVAQYVAMLHPPSDMDPKLLLGQNKVWYAGEEFIKGLIITDPAEIQKATTIFAEQIQITDYEGIQADFSFHQHGAQLYNGGYGLQFIIDNIFYAKILKGTTWAFAQQKINLLASFVLQGTRWMVQGKTIDYGATGRAFTRTAKNNTSEKLVSVCNDLATVCPQLKSSLYNLSAFILGKAELALKGNKYFWRSDFMVERGNNYYASVKLISTRTVGTENGNGENKKGGWVPFGTNYIMRTGDEFEDIFPVWDWTKIPGVTCISTPIILVNALEKGENEFAAGCSDGTHGLASMDLQKDGLTAKKSWFFFNDEEVALGCDITAKGRDQVFTTINQCLQHGDITLGTPELTTITSVHHLETTVPWILHDSIGYFFPKGTNFSMNAGESTGTWREINDMYGDSTIKKNVFTVWINHGISPKQQQYAYIIVPGASASTMEKIQQNNTIKIIRNDGDIQAVTDESFQLTEMVIRKSGTIKISQNMAISVNKPCMLMVNRIDSSSFNITVANTSYNANTINVVLKLDNGSVEKDFNFSGQTNEDINKTLFFKLH